MRAGISLGSNLGDRADHLDRAVIEVTALSATDAHVRVSSYHSTTPVDCPPGSGDFLNAAMEIEWTDQPLTLLHELQRIEAAHGRPKVRSTNSPRPLDLDLLYLDDVTLNTAELVLPHPRLSEREFVLRPLNEISADRYIRCFRKTVSELLSTLKF